MRSDDSHWDHLLLLGRVPLKLAGRETVKRTCGSWNKYLLGLDKRGYHIIRWICMCVKTLHSPFQIWPAMISTHSLCQVWVSSIPVFSYPIWALRFPRMVNIIIMVSLNFISHLLYQDQWKIHLPSIHELDLYAHNIPPHFDNSQISKKMHQSVEKWLLTASYSFPVHYHSYYLMM